MIVESVAVAVLPWFVTETGTSTPSRTSVYVTGPCAWPSVTVFQVKGGALLRGVPPLVMWKLPGTGGGVASTVHV